MIPSEMKRFRRKSRVVSIGQVRVGGEEPIRIQSMLTSDTCNLSQVIEEIQTLVQAGCEIVRLTVPNQRSVEMLPTIRSQMQAHGLEVPLVADIHFNPQLAVDACEYVEKVRINPGNYADRKRFEVREYSDAEYAAELERLEERLLPLIANLKRYQRALRVGTNHGSLSDRILNRFGDTPAGMVESAMEFLRILRRHNYHEIVISMKASNPIVMREAYRQLVVQMDQEGMDYPLHLGVTEAGNGLDGRIKSAVGIGSLLLEGLGDTIRVSLTEPAENEIPAAQAILRGVQTVAPPPKQHKSGASAKIAEVDLQGCQVGGDAPFRLLGLNDFVISGLSTDPFDQVLSLQQLESHPQILHIWESVPESLSPSRLCLVAGTQRLGTVRALQERFRNLALRPPVAVLLPLEQEEERLLGIAAEVGTLLAEQALQGLVLPTTDLNHPLVEMTQMLLQATRIRLYKADFISCPSCGRTHFDLQSTTAAIKEQTAHLIGVKIGIMGCVVNGPGEMADADFGYVGSGPGKVNLYKGQECVRRNVPEEEAVAQLINLIQQHGRWSEPPNSRVG